MKKPKPKPDHPSNLLNLDQVVQLVSVHIPIKFSRASAYRLMKRKQFPKPVKIMGFSFWRREDIEAWITKTVNGRK